MSEPTSFSVPKFSSFKPTVPAKETESKPKDDKAPHSLDSRVSREPRREHRHRSRSRSRDRRRHHHRDDRASGGRHDSGREEGERSRSDRHESHRSHRRRSSRSRSPHRKQVAKALHIEPSKGPESLTFEPASTSFIIDRKGDPQNLVYGRVHRYDIPRFRRVGYGNVMGLPRRFRMERKVSEEAVGIVLVDSRRSVGKREKYVFARNEKKGARLLRIKPLEEGGRDDLLAINGDFVPLSRPKKRKRSNSDSSVEAGYEKKRKRSNSDSSVEAGYEKKHFQLIEMPAGPEAMPEDQDLEYATESDSDTEGRMIKLDEATRQKHVELSRQVDKDPTNLNSWLALINHQDAMLGLGEYAHRTITSEEIQSTAEIKISMYEKALKAAGETLQSRERIFLGIMKEGKKVWSQAEQARRWEKLTSKEVGSSKLWTSYINFRMSDFRNFTYDDIKQLFQNRLSLLAVAKQQSVQKHGTENTEKLETIHQQMVYVLLRATLFMRALGYTELSVAIWQGVLEYNLSCRRNPDGARDGNFDEFWESDVPRIGEEGAEGWKEFTDIEKEPVPDVRTDPETPASCGKNPDILSGWASAERFRARASRWPAKTCDETIEDDPYRVILWSDVKDYLIDFGFTHSGRWEISSASHRMLVDGFLSFCPLPPLRRAGWVTDPFISDGILESSADEIRKQYLSKSDEAEDVLDPPDATRKDTNQTRAQKNIFDTPAQNIVPTTDTLLPSAQWASYHTKWSSLYGPDPTAGPLDILFVSRCLDTLARSYPTDELAEYYLAWTFLNQPSATQKRAKSLIAKQPQSRRLYNAFALILWNTGEKEKAIGVWNLVLSMAGDKTNDILLWRSRIWCHLSDNDSETALKCLLSMGTDKPTTVNDIDTNSSILHMRANQHLSSTRDFLLASASPSLAALHAECLALLIYLSPTPSSSNNRDIEGALASLSHFTTTLQSYPSNTSLFPTHETTLQSSVRLLWHHARTGPFRPVLIRTHLTSALQLFPHNTILLTLYTWNEERARIYDRVRTLLRDTVLLPENDCVSSRLFAIRYEIQRGNRYTVKAAFEKAVGSEGCRGNGGVWRLFVLWCAGSGEGAKEVLFRGLRECPGNKALMMEGFEGLRGVVGDEDVKRVGRVMEEKGCRVHVDLQEWIEEHGDGDG